MSAYYNENDPKAAAWLRELIRQNLIASGYVDERSIEDVRPVELRGYTQCHFLAGVGVWSYALRLAGWPDNEPVWTGSCPCQPFSAAGKGAGFADQRHLWPAWFHLIRECEPAVVFGEQVASKDAEPWIDLVHADMESVGYAFGCVPFPSAGVGAPHIRDRNFWVANANGSRLQRDGGLKRVDGSQGRKIAARHSAESGVVSRMANANGGNASTEREQRSGQQRQQPQDGGAGRVADSMHSERRSLSLNGGDGCDGQDSGREETHGVAGACGEVREWPSPVNGFWRDADWLLCTDGKWRPVEPGSFPLVNGASARVVRLRGYGNAINAEAAKTFIQAAMTGANP